MTQPIDDGDGGRDDDFDWEREGESPSTREQLARLRDGLSRSGGGRRRSGGDAPSDQDAPGAELPGSLDRAIARVGGLLDDVGSSRRGAGVRDPYADFGGQSPQDGRGDGYEAPYQDPYGEDGGAGGGAEPYDDPAPTAPRDHGRRSRAGYGREPQGRLDPEPFDQETFDQGSFDDEPRARRRDRRAARSRKAGFSYDDAIGDPEAEGSRTAARRSEHGGRKRRRDAEFEAGFDDASGDDEPLGRSRDRARPARRGEVSADARWDEPGRRGGRNRHERGRRGGGFDDEFEHGGPQDRAVDDRAIEDPVFEDRAFDDDAFGDDARRDPARPDRSRSGGASARAPRPRRGERGGKTRGGVMDPEAAAAEAEATRGRGSSPFGSLERMLAGRYLRARRKEGFISVIAMLSLLGITLAVAVLIVVMSVMNGFRTEFVSKIVGVDGHMTVIPFDRSQGGFEQTARKIRAVPGVSRAAPLIKGQAFATSRYGGVGVLVRGMTKADLLGVEKVSVSPERSAGSLANFGAGDGIAIGEGLANKLGVGVGDTLNVISPQGSVTPFGVAPKRRVFEVIYVFKIGISWYDSALIFMPLKDAQTFFNRPGGADVIDVHVATPDQLDGYTEDILDTVSGDLSVRTWMDENGTMIGALKTEQSVMFLILSMLILIASLIIISGLIMLVQEKGPDIAILRTMGLGRGGVMRVFFMCGATIGLIGCVVGVTLGVLVALNISDIKEFVESATGARLFPEEVYLFSKLPSRLDWNDVGFTVMITLGLSFIATLYPAWRAASMDPVEALRYE